MNKYCVGIVTFNPDEVLLLKNISSIIPQVKEIIIVDNGSKNIKKVESIAEKYHLTLLKNDYNFGIAKALNQIMIIAKLKKYSMVITLDQDSICPSNYLKEIKKYEQNKNIGIFCPIIEDRNIGIFDNTNKNANISFKKECITSAACTRVSVWEEVGGYDEYMFIDSVDFEFCFRVRKKGYLIAQLNNVVLDHEIGKSEYRKFIFKKVWIKNHSAFRKYYISRNLIYFPRKHKQFFKFLKNCLRITFLLLLTILYESDKMEKSRLILKGTFDGLFCRIRRINYVKNYE